MVKSTVYKLSAPPGDFVYIFGYLLAVHIFVGYKNIGTHNITMMKGKKNFSKKEWGLKKEAVNFGDSDKSKLKS